MISDVNNNSIVPNFDDTRNESLRIVLEVPKDLGHGIFIHLNGYIDTYNSTFFQQKIESVIKAGYLNVVFDCESLNYISSTGVGAFTAFLKVLKQLGGDVVLVAVQANVFEIFSLLGFSKFFNIKGDLSAAVRFLHGEENTVFPKEFSCPECDTQMIFNAPGRYRCSGCQMVIDVDDRGQITLGQ